MGQMNLIRKLHQGAPTVNIIGGTGKHQIMIQLKWILDSKRARKMRQNEWSHSILKIKWHWIIWEASIALTSGRWNGCTKRLCGRKRKEKIKRLQTRENGRCVSHCTWKDGWICLRTLCCPNCTWTDLNLWLVVMLSYHFPSSRFFNNAHIITPPSIRALETVQ